MEANKTTKTTKTPRTRIKRTHTKNKPSITWQDFVPPILLKLGRYLYNLVFHQIEQARTITYIELGVLLVFVATFAFTVLAFKVVPYQVAQFTQTIAEVVHPYSVELTPMAQTKAFKAMVALGMLDDFDSPHGPVVLGVQTGRVFVQENQTLEIKPMNPDDAAKYRDLQDGSDQEFIDAGPDAIEILLEHGEIDQTIELKSPDKVINQAPQTQPNPPASLQEYDAAQYYSYVMF